MKLKTNFTALLLLISLFLNAQITTDIVFVDNSSTIDRVPLRSVYDDGKMFVKVYQNEKKILVKNKFSDLGWDKYWYQIKEVEKIEGVGIKYLVTDTFGGESSIIITRNGEFRQMILERFYKLYIGNGLIIQIKK